MNYNDSPWWFNGAIFTDTDLLDNYIGFVYCISDTINNKKYIGKKLFKKTKRRQIKGKSKRFLIASDWKEYFGSNKELIDKVSELGYTNFKREILRLCTSKGECSYFEAKAQFEVGAILKPDQYYNAWISVRCRREHLKHCLIRND